MELAREVDNGITIYRLSGRLDAMTGPALDQSIESAVNGGSLRLVFDMRGVTYVSSAGLRSILVAAKRAAAAKGGIAIFGLQPAINEVFEITGFHKIIPIVGDEAQARSRVGA